MKKHFRGQFEYWWLMSKEQKEKKVLHKLAEEK